MYPMEAVSSTSAVWLAFTTITAMPERRQIYNKRCHMASKLLCGSVFQESERAGGAVTDGGPRGTVSSSKGRKSRSRRKDRHGRILSGEL